MLLSHWLIGTKMNCELLEKKKPSASSAIKKITSGEIRWNIDETKTYDSRSC